MSAEPTPSDDTGTTSAKAPALSRPGTQKAIAWLAMVAAAVIAVATASRSGAHGQVSKALAWSLLAAVGLSLLLHALGRRLVAVLAIALSVGLVLVTALGEGHPALWAAGALGVVGGLAQLVWAGNWRSRARRYEREAPVTRPVTDLDTWKAMDAGLDPTSDGFGDSLASREDSPHQGSALRPTGSTAPHGHQEDR